MTKLRKFVEADIHDCVELVRTFLNEDRGQGYVNSYLGLDFDAQKVYNTLQRNLNNPDFFLYLIDDGGEILGAICAEIGTPFFSHDKVAYDHFLYLNPNNSNVRYLLRMLQLYKEWAISREAKRWRLCSTTGYKTEKFEKLCQHIGMTKIGTDYEGDL